MDNFYGWHPAKQDGKTIFEFESKEFLVSDEFIEDEDMIDELYDIQSKMDDFYSKYLENKPERKWGD